MRPLDGVRVLDFTEGAQGPFAASLLGDLGAEVLKIERPGGELMRHIGPFRGGLALPMLSIARSRLACLSLDVKLAADRAQIDQLIRCADMVVQNWKPGTDVRLGLDYASVQALQPRIVYVQASGYGSRGPYGAMGAMDSLSQAIGGLSALSGDPAGRGERVRTPILDFISAFVTAEAALVGLGERERTGCAALVDTSQMSAALDAAARELVASAGSVVGPAGRSSRWLSVGGWFACADGEHVSLECFEDADVQDAAAALGLNAGSVAEAAIAEAIGRLPCAEVLERLRGVGLSAWRVERRFDPALFDAVPGTTILTHDLDAGAIRYPQTPFILDATPAQAGPPLGPIGRDNPALATLIARWQSRVDPTTRSD